MSLKHRLRGELVDAGIGLFPLSALLNHSCHSNVVWQVVGGGHAITTRAVRRIEPGEEVSNSYIWQGTVGPKRRAELKRTHGFICMCERCTAPPGSPLYEMERVELGLVCAGGSDSEGHMLLPDEPYSADPSYACALDGCPVRLSSVEAAERVRSVRKAFEALHGQLEREEHHKGCLSAELAERMAAAILSPRHELWRLWTSAVLGLAGSSDSAADATELLLRAFVRQESDLLVPSRAGDEDIFVRVNHAIVAGLDSGLDSGCAVPEVAATAGAGVEALRAAYRMDRIATGVSAEGFLARWLPADFEQMLPDARRALQSQPGQPVSGLRESAQL